MKRSLIAIAAATALGVTALGTTLSLADPGDEAGPGGRPGWGYGMMGPGYGMRGGYGPGYGMMGPGMMGGYGHGHGMRGGYGPGTMGYGPGMMGYGAGNAGVPCPGYATATATEPLSLDDARKAVEQRLAWMGNDRLKVGNVEAKGDNAFIAEIVTTDNSLVDKVMIDRRTGFMRPVR